MGQDIIPAPTGRTIGLPTIIISRLPAHIDHAIDRGAAPQNLATRIGNCTSPEPLFRDRFIQPVGFGIANTIQIAHRNMDPRIAVLSTGLN